MVGEENKNQSFYLGLDKTYEVELVLGVSTDSYDLLGLPNKPFEIVANISQNQLEPALATLTGGIHQAYPPYSAVRVEGKPLYWWARQGRLNEVKIPVAKRDIYQLSILEIQQLSLEVFSTDLSSRIGQVEGDFRQPEILHAWDTLLRTTQVASLWNIKLRVACSSGTYVRGLVHQLGQDLGYGAVTRSIVRTKVGQWELKDAERLSINDK
jgi:tRNA pseudouridine55 synthase